MSEFDRCHLSFPFGCHLSFPDHFALRSQTDTLDSNYATIFINVTPPAAVCTTRSCQIQQPKAQGQAAELTPGPSAATGAVAATGATSHTPYDSLAGGAAGAG